MAEILLGVLTAHLALMTTNGAFHNNFGSGSRRSTHVEWGHTFKLRAKTLTATRIDFDSTYKVFRVQTRNAA